MSPFFDTQILQLHFTSPLKVDHPLRLSAKAESRPSPHCEHPKINKIFVFSPSVFEPLIPSLPGIVEKSNYSFIVSPDS